MKLRVILQGLAVCAAVWVVVIASQKFFGQFRPTAEGLEEIVEEADFADWSSRKGEPSGPEAEERENRIREIAKLVNELDFNEREEARENRTAEDFFWKLSSREQALFVDLTLKESLGRWMAAFDQLPKEEQKKWVERIVKNFDDGRGTEDLDRAKELGSEMFEKIIEEGFEAYLEASAETKMELAPFMEAMNEQMQRMRVPKWEGRGEGDQTVR